MALQQVAADEGVSPAQVALAWVLSRAPNIVPIPGTRSSARLDENLRALDVTLSEEAQQQLAESSNLMPRPACATRPNR